MYSAFTIGGTILVIFLVAGIVGFLFTFTKRSWKHQLEKEQLQTQFTQALLQTQLEIQEQTFKNISEEIHDNVGQVLSLAKLNLNTLGFEDNEKIIDTKNLISKAIADLRNLSHSMHSDRIAQLGLQQSIADELKLISNTGQFITDLKITGTTYSILPQKEMVLFRIIQEGLHNAVKHSKANSINVLLQYDPALFMLTVVDDGVGFDNEKLEAASAGIGFNSMKNRAKLIGGELALLSTINGGTNITVQLPKETLNKI